MSGVLSCTITERILISFGNCTLKTDATTPNTVGLGALVEQVQEVGLDRSVMALTGEPYRVN